MTLHGPERLPPFFATLVKNPATECEWIGENAHGSIKTNPVLALIDRRFSGVPFESRYHTLMLLQFCIYDNGCDQAARDYPETCKAFDGFPSRIGFALGQRARGVSGIAARLRFH